MIYDPPIFSPQVLFRLVLGSAKLGEAALYLTVLGGANLVFVSIVPIILLLTGAEDFGSPRDIPWHSLCCTAALLLGKVTVKGSLSFWNVNVHTHMACDVIHY